MTTQYSSCLKQEVATYVKQDLRNKIVFSKQCIEGLQYLNVGLTFAKMLRDNSLPSLAIQQLFSDAVKADQNIGRYLAIFNIDIANSTSKCKITKCFCKSTPLVLRNSISFLVSH